MNRKLGPSRTLRTLRIVSSSSQNDSISSLKMRSGSKEFSWNQGYFLLFPNPRFYYRVSPHRWRGYDYFDFLLPSFLLSSFLLPPFTAAAGIELTPAELHLLKRPSFRTLYRLSYCGLGIKQGPYFSSKGGFTTGIRQTLPSQGQRLQVCGVLSESLDDYEERLDTSSRWGRVVEHMPCGCEVVGLKTTACWAFSLILSLVFVLFFLSSFIEQPDNCGKVMEPIHKQSMLSCAGQQVCSWS